MGIIYKITDNTNNSIYIGSTKQSLKLREQNHKRLYKSYLKGGEIKGYTASFDILKNNDYKIELIEETNDIKIREQYWIETLDCINKINAKVNIKKYQADWYEDNKERILEKAKQYSNDNTDKIKEYQKEYRQQNKEKARLYLAEWRKKQLVF